MNRRRRSTLAALAIGLLAGAFAWFGTRHVAPLRQASLFLDDFRLAHFAEPRPQRDDIVILAINEETLASVPFRSPVNRRLVADLVDELARRNVRALGLDIIFDQPTNADDDRALREALDRFPRPAVIAVGDAANGLTPRQLAFQSEFLSESTVGLAGLLTTGGVVRYLYAGERGDGGFRLSFAAALAAAAGASAPREPQLLYYRTVTGDAPLVPLYPAHYLSLLPAARFEGRVVLIGADLPNQDTFRTPLSVPPSGTTMTGVHIHAQALGQLLDGAEFPAIGDGAAATILVGAVLLGLGLAFAPLGLWPKILLGAGALAGYWALGVGYFATGGALLPLFMPTAGFLLATSLGGAYARHEGEIEKRFIRDAFRRYVSPGLIDDILADPTRLVLGGERREMSFVFSDLEGFTTLAEKLTPDATVALLQEYLNGMLRIALEAGGTIDRVVGDGIAVFFGAPLRQADHAARAVGCALEWDRYSEEFRAAQRAKGFELGITRIGVHTGSAVVGNVGSSDRFHYTAHGDCVNTAARLEGANRHLGTRVCVSKAAASHRPNDAFVPIGSLVLKGKSEALACVTPAHALPEQLRKGYLEAYELLAVDRDSSERRFAALNESWPAEPLLRLHLGRLRRGEAGETVVLEEK
jgi:class 3 adenylate cyclase